MNRADRRSPWIALLAVFAAALSGPPARAQRAFEGAAPSAALGANISPLSSPASPVSALGIHDRPALPASPIYGAASTPLARPQAAARPDAPAVPAAPAAAPTAAAALRSMSDRSAALAAPDAAASQARALSEIAFDEAMPFAPDGAALSTTDGPAVSAMNGRLRRFANRRSGRKERNQALPSARPSAPPAEKPGLTRALLDKLVGTVRLIDEDFVDRISSEKWGELIDKGLAAIVNGLEEPHTEYYDKEGWARNVQNEDGTMTGIGATMDVSREQESARKAFEEAKAKAGVLDEAAEEQLAEKIPLKVLPGGLRIKSVAKGSPAEAAGLQDGDVLTHVDGEAIEGKSIEETMGMIHGKTGTPVRLKVSRGGAGLDFTVTRAELEQPLLTARLVAPGIGYIYYSQFRKDSEDEFVAAVYDLQKKGAKKIVIDLRGNPGGNLTTAGNILGAFLPAHATVFTTRHRGEIAMQGETEIDGPFVAMKKIVLVDGGSASGSELSATTLQDYGVTVVGPSKSYGKFSFQYVLPLPPDRDPRRADSGIRITSGRFYSGKNRSFPGRHDPATGINVPGSGGVTPDVIVPMSLEEERAAYIDRELRLHGEDPAPVADAVLEKAIEILQSSK